MIKLAGPAMSATCSAPRPASRWTRCPPARLQRALPKRFNVPVQLYAPYSYDAASALIEAMKLADSADPAKYLPLLQKVSFKGVTGNIAFDASGDSREGVSTSSMPASGKPAPDRPRSC
jgi:branched-chain amino acid transport system substrate-binding protein